MQHFSTWRLAEKYEISQTRVRQIVKAVTNWLAVTLPAKTEAEQEQETRLAQHIAADQLQHQIELMQHYFDGSGDPKYLRQQNRAILSLARLGIIPGSIDSLAADAELCRVGCAHQDSGQDLVTRVPPGHAPTRGSSLADPPTSATSTNPPLGDCSPITTAHHSENPTPENDPASTPLHAEPSRQIEFPYENALAGLCIMEKNLLTLIDNTTHDDHDRLESLNYSLTNIRRQKATLQLRLSSALPGAEITEGNAPTFNSLPQAPAPA